MLCILNLTTPISVRITQKKSRALNMHKHYSDIHSYGITSVFTLDYNMPDRYETTVGV
jgi:hypothetical protein